MRKLNTTDTFKAFRLISKSNLRTQLTALIKEIAEKGYESVMDVGLEGFMIVIDSLSETNSEKQLYELLSGPYEMSAKEVAELAIDEQLNKLIELKEVSNLDSFFTVLYKLLTKKR